MPISLQDVFDSSTAERMSQQTGANNSFLQQLDRYTMVRLIEPDMREAAADRQLMSRETPINNTQP